MGARSEGRLHIGYMARSCRRTLHAVALVCHTQVACTHVSIHPISCSVRCVGPGHITWPFPFILIIGYALAAAAPARAPMPPHSVYAMPSLELSCRPCHLPHHLLFISLIPMLVPRAPIPPRSVCGVSSLELSWRPPTKNADRIERYKLMIATGTGVVKDVYQVGAREGED